LCFAYWRLGSFASTIGGATNVGACHLSQPPLVIAISFLGLVSGLKLIFAPHLVPQELQQTYLGLAGLVLFVAGLHGIKRGFNTDPPPDKPLAPPPTLPGPQLGQSKVESPISIRCPDDLAKGGLSEPDEFNDPQGQS
jgi:hypothetical protein